MNAISISMSPRAIDRNPRRGRRSVEVRRLRTLAALLDDLASCLDGVDPTAAWQKHRSQIQLGARG